MKTHFNVWLIQTEGKDLRAFQKGQDVYPFGKQQDNFPEVVPQLENYFLLNSVNFLDDLKASLEMNWGCISAVV